MGSLVKKGSTYYAVFKSKGKAKWIRIGKVNSEQARKVLRKLEQEAELRKFGILEDPPEMSLKEFVPRYLEYTKTSKAHNTYRREKIALKPLLSILGGVPLTRITTETIDSYKATRIKQVEPRTVNLELLCLSSMLKKALEWNLITHKPKTKLLKETKKQPKVLSIQEMDRLIESASPWLRPILIVLRNTGIRSCELTSLRWKDIDFENELITVRNTKGNQIHWVPMNQEVKPLLLWLKNHYVCPNGKVEPRKPEQMEFVFCNPDGKPVKRFYRSLYRLGRKLGIRVSPHALRHSFATFVAQTQPLHVAQELLGHRDISTTRIYAHVNLEMKRDAVRKLPWLGSLKVVGKD